MALALYINMARDQLRDQAMTHAFADCRYIPERFEAVDWRALTANKQSDFYVSKVNRSVYFRPLTAGECGCYASHVEVWRRLLDSDEPWALVLEDDVEPMQGFDDVMDAVDQLPPEWDMIKLVGRTREKISRRHPLVASHGLVQYRRVPSLTGAYVISREGARKVLASRVPFGRPIDIDLRWWWENDLRLFGVDPYPIKLAATSENSTIGLRKGVPSVSSRVAKLIFNLKYNFQMAWEASRLVGQWRRLTST